MQLNTVIFDIDGLLIDSEPLWAAAATQILKEYNIALSDKQYKTTTGLRTKEFVHWWLHYFKLDANLQQTVEKNIIDVVLQKIKTNGTVMPGAKNIIYFFKEQQFKIGLATSSPKSLIDLVIDMLQIKDVVMATASAEDLAFGKPHPQVYLNCAEQLNSHPLQCVCFEDSFNGMIAAKAARMKCVVVPHHSQIKEECWAAADLKLSSLHNFNSLLLQKIQS
jgi:HAD superfamily hydrolase (TIGR01509 family)